jgi:signal transduction histidine kinase
MTLELLLRRLWPIPLALAATTLALSLEAPIWALSAIVFTAGGLTAWSAAYTRFGQRKTELEAAVRRLEQDLAESRRLEQERGERSAELLHSQKLEALGTLAGGVAHDLNNMLVPVLSLAKVVMSKLPPGSREYASAELMLDAGRRARDLVRQVLAFSRKTAADRRPLALDGFVADVLKKMRPSLPAGIEIEQHLATVPPVAADGGQLEQVLAALLSNAIQAIADGVGTVTIEVAGDDARLAALRPSAAGVPGVRLTVRDTGCGMDAVTKRRIFEPFFTTREVGRGTGLGLAVVHGIVTGHGGDISVESEPGVGTRFDILLPCMAAETTVAAAAA